MTTTRKIGKTHQNVLVFGKGQETTAITPAHQNLLVFSKGDVRRTNAVVRNAFDNIQFDVDQGTNE